MANFSEKLRGIAGAGSLYAVVLVLCGCQLAQLLFPENSYAVRRTNVRHLFDIEHNFSQPSDVSVAGDGRIYVVDGVNNSIKVFDPDGGFLFAFGRAGNGPGQLRFPLGIDLDEKGRVYIADSGNHRIQIYSSTGEYLRQIVLPSVDGKPADPTDVAVDRAGRRCYVVDNDNHHIVAYDLESGRKIDTFGTPGAEKKEFRYPFLAFLQNDKYLYITEVINTRVQVLTTEGLWVAMIGDWGVEKGQFYRPKGVAVDRDGLIYISDGYMGVIQVFNLTGSFHSVLADPSTSQVRKFTSPTGMFIDGLNRLFVVEMFANKVGVYAIEDVVE